MPDPQKLIILTELREAAGLTLTQMARTCGLTGKQSRLTAGAWERGEYAPDERRRRTPLSAICGMTCGCAMTPLALKRSGMYWWRSGAGRPLRMPSGRPSPTSHGRPQSSWC
ncbi:MAG: hypothetical protein R2911_00120 [Caldilineaceae bacterium]